MLLWMAMPTRVPIVLAIATALFPVVGFGQAPADAYQFSTANVLNSDALVNIAKAAPGNTTVGLCYGLETMVQLLKPRNGALWLPEAHIEDWPDLPVRGVMLDISRDKVPTLDTMKALIDRLASLSME